MLNKIQELMQEQKKSQADLSKFLGIPTGNLSNIFTKKGRHFSTKQIGLLSKYFKVSTDYLYGFTNFPNQKLVPLIGKSSCGKPQEYTLSEYEGVSVPVNIYKDSMYAVEADGDSMSPKINNGDIVYCLPNQIIDNGNTVHYWLNGESGIKKYKINETGTIISLIPINPDYDIITIEYTEKYDLIMAKVVGSFDRDF